MTNEKIYQMDFAKIYQLLVDKAVRKGRTKQEVDEVTCWLTGYSQNELERMQNEPLAYAAFFADAGNPLFGQAGGRAGERKIDGENTPSVAHQLDPNQI